MVNVNINGHWSCIWFTISLLTQDIGGSVSSYEAGVVTITHAFLQNPLAKIFSESTASCHQAVIPAIGLGKAAEDSPGNQSAIRKYGEHSPKTSAHQAGLPTLASLVHSPRRVSIAISLKRITTLEYPHHKEKEIVTTPTGARLWLASYVFTGRWCIRFRQRLSFGRFIIMCSSNVVHWLCHLSPIRITNTRVPARKL